LLRTNSYLKFVDPEKVIEQAVMDMQTDLVKIRQSYAEISATQKRMEKQNDVAVSAANDWYRRAQLALDKGDEELAREALSRRQTQLEIAENLQKQMSLQEAAIKKLYSSMTALETKITEAKRQKEALIARARTAKTSVEVNDMLSGLNSLTGSSGMDSFERMRAKVETLESQAEVAGELAANNAGTSVNLEEKFRELEGSSKIDKELDLLRRQLPGTQKKVERLPSSIDGLENLSALDLEYERMKRELRR
jgi:phage shock protein A